MPVTDEERCATCRATRSRCTDPYHASVFDEPDLTTATRIAESAMHRDESGTVRGEAETVVAALYRAGLLLDGSVTAP